MSNSANIQKTRIYALMTLVWIGIILSFSLQPGDKSSQMSSGVGSWFAEVFFGNLKTISKEQVEFLHFLLRKCGHFLKFFILGILGVLTVSQTNLRHKGVMGIVFCAAIASIDETIQLFVPGRSGQISDVLLDSVGAMVGIGAMLVMKRAKKKKKVCKN